MSKKQFIAEQNAKHVARAETFKPGAKCYIDINSRIGYYVQGVVVSIDTAPQQRGWQGLVNVKVVDNKHAADEFDRSFYRVGRTLSVLSPNVFHTLAEMKKSRQ